MTLLSAEQSPFDRLAVELARQQQFMDMLCQASVAGYEAKGGKIRCARGCSGCCSLVVNCSVAEALSIAAVLDNEQAARVDAHVERLKILLDGVPDLKGYLRMHRSESGGCPLLARDGSCGIYSSRPLSCRALLSTMESRWCVTDFAELTRGEKQSFVESLDREAVAFPTHYLSAGRDAGAELENLLSMHTAMSFGFSLYGNMPVLVHLAGRHDLKGAMELGRSRVEELLAETGLENPLLLQVEAL